MRYTTGTSMQVLPYRCERVVRYVNIRYGCQIRIIAFNLPSDRVRASIVHRDCPARVGGRGLGGRDGGRKALDGVGWSFELTL